MSRVATILGDLDGHLAESMGVRDESSTAQRFPKTNPQDIGRQPLPEVARIDMAQVIPDPDQPRVEFSEEALQSLADSIHERGQLSPILVRWSDTHQKWVIIAGERRWLATQRAELTTISCHCRIERFSSSEILEQQLIENCLREDLTAIEEARAFRKLASLNGWNGKQIAESLRVTQTRVSRALALLRLPADLIEEIEAGRLPVRSAYELTKLPTEAAQRSLAKQIIEQTLTAGQTSMAVRQRKGTARQRRTIRSLRFQSESGLKMTITPRPDSTYSQVEEFLTEVLEEVRHRIENRVHL